MIGDLFVVARSIPNEAIGGLMSGKLNLAGGVIRHAAGSAEGGQIFAHLLPAASSTLSMTPVGGIAQGIGTAINTYQLHQIGGQLAGLTEMTQALTQIATTTMVLSGLTLGVSLVGFSVIIYQLRQQTKILKDIQKDVKWIKVFLESERRAKLFSCLENLDNLPEKKSTRNSILEDARKTLSEAVWHYCLSIDSVNDIDEAMAIEAEYSLALLALARCSSELGLFDVVVSDFEKGIERWREMTIPIAQNLILKDRPLKFLAPFLTNEIPASQLITWMDFVNQEKKGVDWLDTMREDMINADDPWFGKKSKHKELSRLAAYMNRLVARENAFEGYLSQYRYTCFNHRTPAKVEAEINRHLSSRSNQNEELVVLKPNRRQQRIELN